VPKKRKTKTQAEETKSSTIDETPATSPESDEFQILIPPEHLTRFERSRIIGAIALQISMGAPILIELESETHIDPIEVAKKELEADILPLTIRRTKPNGFFQDIPLTILLKNPLSFR